MRIGVVWMEQYQDGGDVSASMIGGGGACGEAAESWGTWEELLLACAVKRHGVEDWESVAMEVQGKTALPQLLTTAFNCKLKYHDLQRRFHQADDADAADDPDPIPWLHHLKNQRLAQLRQDLHRYDVSIMSLRSKVKRLEEEGKHDEDDNPKPDLEEHNSKRSGRSEDKENDKKAPDGPDRSKHENQSVNGSNSTCSKTQEDRPNSNNKQSFPAEPDPLPPGSAQPSKSDSDKGSCETVRRQEREPGGSSEAQSSASLTRKRRRKLELQDQPSEQGLGNSQPLVAVLQMIRAHQHGSLFERRLTSQESDKYKSMVQQHVDLETIEAKLQNLKDSSSTSTLPFYRDLLLLFTNAVVFFPKFSTESVAAHQLRRLVLNEMKKSNLITRPDHPSSGPSDSLPSQATIPTLAQARLLKHELERSDSLLAKHKSTTPIFFCRKRSSISSKPPTIASKASTAADHQEAEVPAASDMKPLNNSKANNAEEDNRSATAAAKANKKPVTGTRSSRRTTSTQHDSNAKASSTKKKGSSPAETPKSGKKRKTPEEPATPSDKKRSGAAEADFLKRLKRNSPAQQKPKLKSGTGTSTSGRGAEQRKRGGNKADKVKERVSKPSGGENKKQVKEESSPSKRSVERPSKKAAETSAAANVVSPKRSRENGTKQQQEASKRPKNRSRR